MRAAAHFFGRLLTGLILTLGLLTVLAFAATPLLENYREEVAGMLADRLATPVTIDRLEAHWHPLGPQLQLSGVRLGSGTDVVQLGDAELDIHWPGLLGDDAGLLRLTLRDARVLVVRETSGQIHLAGVPTPTAGGHGDDGNDSQNGAAFVLPLRLRLLQTEVVWEDRKHGRPPLRLFPVTTELAGRAGAWQIEARIDSPHGSIAVAARVRGALSGLQWHGTARLRVDDLDLPALVGAYLPAHYHLAGMRLNADLLSDWQDAQPSRVDGRLEVRDLRLAGDAEVHLNRLSAEFAFARRAADWRLQMDGVQIERAGRTWPRGRLAAALSQTAGGTPRLDFGADFVRLEDVLAVLMIRPPWPELEQLVRTIDPRADLRDVRASLSFGDEGPDWRFAGEVEDLRLEPGAASPGVTGVDGRVRARADQVQLDLDSRDAVVAFDGLFRAPLALDRLTGRLDWQPAPTGGWTLTSDELVLDSPHLSTRNRLLARAVPGEPLFLDLQSDFRDGDGTHAGLYYPVGILNPELVAWLDRSIVEGRVTRGTALFHGPIDDFAFDKTHNGHFEVVFGVRDVTLDYREGWPRLEDVEAELRFHNNDLAVTIASARVLDSAVRGARAVIRRLDPIAPVEITGSVVGPLADELRILGEGPLSQDFGSFVDGLRADGEARLDLALRVPLDTLGEYRLDGKLHFLDNRLELVDWQLPLEAIRGTLAFDLSTLRASAIRARALGSDLSVDVGRGKAGGTWITARGPLDIQTIQQRLPHIPLARAGGRSDFTVQARVPDVTAPPDTPTVLVVRSQLEGVAIDLPPPFGKPATEARALTVQVPVSGRGGAVRVTYADRLRAVAAADLSRGHVVLGAEGEATLPTRPMLRVDGRLARLEAAAWLAVIDDLAAADGRVVLPVMEARLAFDEVAAEIGMLPEVSLALVHESGRWHGSVDSPRLVGGFSVPADLETDPIAVELERLVLETEFRAEEPVPADPTPPAPLDPRDLPGVDLTCRSLKINQADLGAANVRLRRQADGLHSEVLRLEGGQATLDGSLAWRFGAAGIRTEVDLQLASADLGLLLEQLGFTPQLKNTPFEGEARLAWPHDPFHPMPGRLSGQLELALGEGRLLDLDPGVTRVVGILNFAALQRRLRLDFSDLFKKGFSFDSITGTFTLDGGNAYTNDLAIRGPSGEIDIAGRTGLTARDFDQLVTLTPRLDATLPIAGTVAGGPLAGLAVLLAQELMSDEVDRINRFQYAVKGPWAAPEVRALDSGGTLSKLVRALSAGTRGDDNRPTQAPPPDAPDSSPEPAEAPDDSEGSPLERWLERLEPSGSGREILEAGD